MLRRYGVLSLIGLIVVVIAGAGLYGLRRVRGQTPLSMTGPNIVQNNDFSQDADTDGLPDGWSRGTIDVKISDYGVEQGSRSVQLLGINNFLKSPYVAARPANEYRVAFRALADKQATSVRVLFHWRDAEGIDIKTTPGAWQAVKVQEWSIVQAADSAPDGATQVAISIRPQSDDAVYIDDLSLGQLGVRVNPWPAGKRAALAFSFDYETAMGGLVHSRSGDTANTQDTYLQRARRMRAGLEQTLKLFKPYGIRATYYVNGYNFLTGNTERRAFMNNPTFDWANTANRWETDQWKTKPWFADDPYKTEAAAPEWYFGSQIDLLKNAQQDLQSHTFSHLAGTYVTPDDWRRDFAAWQQVAQERGVAPASSLAFPWSSSAGMTAANWAVLEAAGIRSVTRTTWEEGQRRSWIADREQWALRRLPGSNITVVPDIGDNLAPRTRDATLQKMRAALLNEGVIDVWAHTEEVTSAEQIATWQAVLDAARPDFWIAPVSEIVQYAQDVRQVTVEAQAEQPEYRFVVRNGSDRDLTGVTLTLPFAPTRITVDDNFVQPTGSTVTLDLKRGEARTIVLYTSQAQEAIWPVS